jgi:SPX domain protein involved in polyphosphate accumulation
MKKRKITRTLVKDHAIWLLDHTNWNDKNSIDLTISKIKTLERIYTFDNELYNKIREKMNSLENFDIIKSVLSDESRTWITNKLGR